jgi:hypothetical protein
MHDMMGLLSIASSVNEIQAGSQNGGIKPRKASSSSILKYGSETYLLEKAAT